MNYTINTISEYSLFKIISYYKLYYDKENYIFKIFNRKKNLYDLLKLNKQIYYYFKNNIDIYKKKTININKNSIRKFITFIDYDNIDLNEYGIPLVSTLDFCYIKKYNISIKYYNISIKKVLMK